MSFSAGRQNGPWDTIADLGEQAVEQPVDFTRRRTVAEVKTLTDLAELRLVSLMEMGEHDLAERWQVAVEAMQDVRRGLEQ